MTDIKTIGRAAAALLQSDVSELSNHAEHTPLLGSPLGRLYSVMATR